MIVHDTLYVFLCFRSDYKLMVVFSILKRFLFPLIACFAPFSLGKGFSSWTLDFLSNLFVKWESLFKLSTCDRNLQKCASLAAKNSEFHVLLPHLPVIGCICCQEWLEIGETKHPNPGASWKQRFSLHHYFIFITIGFDLHSSLLFVLYFWSFRASKQLQTPHFTQLAGCFIFFLGGYSFNHFFHHLFHQPTFKTPIGRSNLQRTDQPSHAPELQSSNGLRLRIWRLAFRRVFTRYSPTGKSRHFCRVCYILYTHSTRICLFKVRFVTMNPHWRSSFSRSKGCNSSFLLEWFFLRII